MPNYQNKESGKSRITHKPRSTLKMPHSTGVPHRLPWAAYFPLGQGAGLPGASTHPNTDHALGVEDLKIPCLNNPEQVLAY